MKRVVDSLAPEGDRYTVWDTQLKGFGVRVSTSDKKTYVVRYRTIGRADRLLQIARHGVVTRKRRATALLPSWLQSRPAATHRRSRWNGEKN